MAIVLFGLSVAAWIKSDDLYSDSERRYLNQAPKLSIDTVKSGTYMKSFESYTVDQFPARSAFRQLRSTVTMYGLVQKDIHDIYIYNGFLSKMEYPLNISSLDHAANVFRNIYERYLENTDVNVYFSIIPDKNCFMAEESDHLAMDYEALYEYMKVRTDYMEFIEIASLLELESYYKTDTHWRQERIADVAQKLVTEMNQKDENILQGADGNLESIDRYPMGNVEYTEKLLEIPFYGVYAGQSGLRVDGEELIYLEHENFTSCKVYDYENAKETVIYDMEKAYGKDPYELFLSGAISLLTIDNPKAVRDRELIIFRDSFGSALTPLLVNDYAKITLVDIRYISSALLEQWIQFEDQDVLFLYSTQVLNNSETMK